MWGKDYLNALHNAQGKDERIEVDRTRVKPVVKITGEFWAQLPKATATSTCSISWSAKAHR